VMERRDPVQGAMLRQWLDNHVLANYAERIVPVSVGIARRCASLHVPEPMSSYDAMIAATALEHSLTVVTRNIKDFQKTSVKLLNPWVSNDDS
ncbi:MAG: PIN domain-containing protein, partial [Cyanobacteria bacterium P01_G01_bin.38]